jgi:uncharacterized damage-inducible protein DinB
MDESERRTHLATLKATPARLRAALKGVPRKLALWSPAPGKWSIQEIVCHMRDMESHAYLERYRRILAEDNPSLPDIDGDAWALEGDYRSLKLGEVVRDWTHLRRECLVLLRGVKGEQWRRAGTHETAGVLTMEDFLRRHAVGNDEAHLGQIDAIRRRFELLSRLEAGPPALAEASKGIDAETARRRPAPDKWSIVEIACHLRDAERVYAERFTKVAHQDRPSFWIPDNDRLAERLRYREADLASVVKDFRRLREDTLVLLRALPHPVWQRTGLHPRRGEETLETLAGHLADHDRGHIEKIRSFREQGGATPHPP